MVYLAALMEPMVELSAVVVAVAPLLDEAAMGVALLAHHEYSFLD